MSEAADTGETIAATFARAREAIASATQLAQRSREAQLARHGSPDQVFASMRLDLIDSAGDPNLQRFYALYEQIFTLPDERESYSGFDAVFGFNRDPQLHARFGFFNESALCASDRESGELVAATNFTTYELPREVREATGVIGTGHVVYLFVRPDFRMLGVASRLMRVMKRYAQNLLQGRRGMDAVTSPPAEDKKILHLCEQNAPEQMTLAEYIEDSRHARIDQCERLVWWLNQGYRRLDFRYLQPPLDETKGPCTNLTLNIEVDPGVRSVPSSLVRAHLERFLTISVLKGADANADASYSAMIDELSRQDSIMLSGTRDYYAALKAEIYALAENACEQPPGVVLRELIGG